ncbi:MAG: aspartate kinase [Gammaproteobacteria bacterium]|nr:aspartate kinase [Gammaproteobacteria bacterium]
MANEHNNQDNSESRGQHTVEKIGGTSMSRVNELMSSVLIGNLKGSELYQRVFVVSAYAGVTDMLLEHKRSGDAGVYALFNEGEDDGLWQEALAKTLEHMCDLNSTIFDHEDDCRESDDFIRQRVEEVRKSLEDLQSLCSSGHFHLDAHLGTVREMLAALGEVHSAHNTALLMQRHGVAARFVDLSGWGEMESLPLDEYLGQKINEYDLSRELPICTGYAKCAEGLMKTYDRGYSEITFSRLASVSGAREAIIHKEYHLCSADPKIVGVDKAVAIGRTNYDVADQLSVLGMEAIHPGAAQTLRRAAIPLRVRHSFEPHHAGTLIEADYQSEQPRVEIIAGRRGVYAVEFFSHDIVDRAGHAFGIQKILDRYKLRTVTRESNANSITYYLATTLKNAKRIERDLEETFPNATITVRRVAIVAAVGSNLDVSGLLSKCVLALAEGGINVLAVHQSMRAVDIKFVVDENDLKAATVALHERAVEGMNGHTAAAASQVA